MVVAFESQQQRAARREREDNEKSREVRLGVVMYGGISLAIYINGVAQELFSAVRGRGVYSLLKALTDSDVVVDVISGTSAGGINGIFLSYALCNEKEFSDFASLWREHGDINRLLRAPDDEMPEASSFLDSEGYYQPHLEASFQAMGDYNARPGEDPSALRELDLFVTGTDVDGKIYTQLDDAGHPIDIKDHRAVFLLKYRKDRKNPFDSTQDPKVTHEALARLSRITSCFPVAFAPVHVDFVEEGDATADARLQRWGKLGKEACFLDGGLLDNKPFTYTLKAIFSRTADREVDRKLFYVEPDPEVMRQAERASNPNFLQAALAALIGIPGYESIAEDLKLLAERNSRLTQYKRLVRRFETPSGEIPPETRKLYDRSRLVALSERVVAGLFRKDGRNQQIPLEHRETAARLVRKFDDLMTDASVLEDLDVPFRLRRLYRLIYMIYELLYGTGEQGWTRAELAEDKRLRYHGLWKALNRQIKLYEVVLAAMESLVDEAPIQWQKVDEKKEDEIWPLVEASYYELLAANGPAARHIQIDDLRAILDENRDEWMSSRDLEEIRRALRETSNGIIEAVLKGELKPKTPGAGTFLALVDTCERLLLDHFTPEENDPVRRAYQDFKKLDAHLYPLELVGNLHEKDIIETIRISPKDARRGFSALDLSAKVSGDAVYHFGGFFKRSWRSNDILWGRLDGLCQLVETLLDRDRMRALVSDPECREKIRGRFLDGDVFRMNLDPATLFSRSGERTRDELRGWLTDLLGVDPAAREAALAEKRFDEMVTLLVEAAQLEVLDDELPKVMTDAIQEQIEWNRFQMVDGEAKPADPSGTRPPFVFEAGRGYLDPLVAGSEVQVRVQQSMAALGKDGRVPARPIQTGLGSFFKDVYKVGSETLLRDIPTLVLLETLAKALLVARTCILGLFGSEASRIRGNPLYRFCIDWPLRAFHALVSLARRKPGWGLGVFLGLGVVSLLALVVGILWWPDLKESQPRMIAFAVAPAVVLLGQLIFLLWGLPLLFRRRGLWAFFAALISAVALFCGIAQWDQLRVAGDEVQRLGVAFLVVLPALVLLIELLVIGLGAWRRSRRRREVAGQRREREQERHLGTLRRIAAEKLKERFGPLSGSVREKLEAIESVEKMARLLAASGTAASLAALGLQEEPQQLPKEEEVAA